MRLLSAWMCVCGVLEGVQCTVSGTGMYWDCIYALVQCACPSYVLICPMQCDLCMPLAMSLYEIEIENTLACLSGAQMGSNHEKKTGGRTSRDTLPLTKPTGPLLGMASISQRYSYRKFEIFFIQLYHWHRTAWLSSVNMTLQIFSIMQISPWNRYYSQKKLLHMNKNSRWIRMIKNGLKNLIPLFLK